VAGGARFASELLDQSLIERPLWTEQNEIQVTRILTQREGALMPQCFGMKKLLMDRSGRGSRLVPPNVHSQ
jgi:hypothetical protein